MPSSKKQWKDQDVIEMPRNEYMKEWADSNHDLDAEFDIRVGRWRDVCTILINPDAQFVKKAGLSCPEQKAVGLILLP